MAHASMYDSPEEIRRRKNFKKGIEFTLLVCGQQGLGKTSFINSLCKQVVSQKDTSHVDPKQSHLSPGMSVSRCHVNIVEADSTPITLDIISAPGLGDNIDNKTCVGKIVEFLEDQFDKILNEEYRIQRNSRFKDGRPHAALYFIRPTCKGLRELDIDTMKKLSTRVNVIPVIGKADSLTKEELKLNKALILQDLKANDIRVFDFCGDEDGDNGDPGSSNEFAFFKDLVPFAISGSYEVKDIDGKPYHVREYPWGVFKVEDVDHSDFTYLRNALFGSHLQELKDSTHKVLYENYRRERLAEHSDYASKVNSCADDEFISNLDHFTESEGIQTDDTLREILKKKKMIESYATEIKQLEQRLRLSQLAASSSKPTRSHSATSSIAQGSPAVAAPAVT